MKHFRTSTFALLSAALLSACTANLKQWQAYPGPQRPASQVALLKIKDSAFNLAELNVVLPYRGWPSSSLNAASIAVGTQSVTAWYSNRGEVHRRNVRTGLVTRSMENLGLIGEAKLSFNAEAGHEYTVHAARANPQRNAGAHIWIVDDTTGQIVAGRKP
jgi:hypothetical protein